MGLADRLGKTLDEVFALGPEEIALWMAWTKDDPRVAREKRMDERFGMLLALTANLHSTKNGWTPEDWFPSLGTHAEVGASDVAMEKRALAKSGRIVREPRRTP